MRVVLIFLFVLLSLNAAVGRTSDLRQQLLECADKVGAWQIEYDVVSPGMKPGDKVIHRNVALRFPDKLFHWAGNVPYQSGQSWTDDVFQQRTVVTGEQYYWDFPRRRASTTRSCDRSTLFPGTLKRELLWEVLIWWPFTTDSNHQLSSESSTVEDVLRDDSYHFVESQEIVDGQLCYVLRRENVATLWFDCETPSIMRRREWYDLPGFSVWRAEMSDHYEVETGIFCPRKITWTGMRRNETEGKESPVIEFAALIVSAKFNESVPENLFDFPEPLPGHVESTDDGYKQIRPGANEYADSILGWVKTVAPPNRQTGLSRWELAFHTGLYCLAAVLSVRVGARWWKSRNGVVGDVKLQNT